MKRISLILALSIIFLMPASSLAQLVFYSIKFVSQEEWEAMQRRARQRESKRILQLYRWVQQGKYKKAFGPVKSRAGNGDKRFQTLLGHMYIQGLGVQPNTEVGFKWLYEAAKKNYRDAQYFIGLYFYEGKYVKRDLRQTVKWWKRAALGKGHKEASSRLSQMYLNGYGVRKNYKQALYYLGKASRFGLDPKLKKGLIYLEGGFGVEQDFAKAYKWLEGDSREKNSIAFAFLGHMYRLGHGVEKNDEKAKELFQKAIPNLEARAAKKDTLAIMTLANVYHEGYGVDKDLGRAKELLSKTPEKRDCLNALAIMQWKGEGGYEADSGKALAMFEKAAKKGSANAMSNFGEFLYMGRGCPKDEAKAKEWFKRGANSGDGTADYYLAVLGSSDAQDEEAKKEVKTHLLAAYDKLNNELAMGNWQYRRQYLEQIDTKYGELLAEAKTERKALEKARLAALAKADEKAKLAEEKSRLATQKRVKLAKEAEAKKLKALKAKQLAEKKKREEAARKLFERKANEAKKRELALRQQPRLKKKKKEAVAKPAGEVKPVELDKFYAQVNALVKEYYDRAKFKKDDQKLHFQFKVKKAATTSGKIMTIPKLDGILCDMECKSGRYQGKKYLPLETHEIFYSELLLAPYSSSGDCHLYTKLLFPPNTPAEFIGRFKKLVSEFEAM